MASFWQSFVVTAASPATEAAPAAKKCNKGPKLGKSGKKICCSCPETRKARDNCVLLKGAENCLFEINAHKACLREEGFVVK